MTQLPQIGFAVLGWVLPIALAPILYVVAREVLNAHRRIDDLPPFAKRAAVLALGTLIAAVFNALGVALPPECVSAADDVTTACTEALNTPTVVRGVTAGVVAMIMHQLKKEKPNE